MHTVNKKNVSLRISENNASAAGIFYGELGLTVLTSDTTLKKKCVSAICELSKSWKVRTDGPGKMVSMECLHVLDLERVKVKVI